MIFMFTLPSEAVIEVLAFDLAEAEDKMLEMGYDSRELMNCYIESICLAA